jgi:hypothetical protein
MNNYFTKRNESHILMAPISFWIAIIIKTFISKSFNLAYIGKIDSSVSIFGNFCDFEPRFILNFFIRILYAELIYLGILRLLVSTQKPKLSNLAMNISLLLYLALF